MTQSHEELVDGLAEVFGTQDPLFSIVAEMDPAITETYIGMARAAITNNALSQKAQALVNIGLNASVTHLKPVYIRIYIAAALSAGASAGEIREVLQLCSVLGIHGTIPGTQILAEREGGLAAARDNGDPERRARADEAAVVFEAKRGPLSPAWQTNCLFAPELVEAYADFSGVPWATSHLSGKMKELIYVAIDLSPTHVHMRGATVHMEKARNNFGCSEDEIVSVLKLIALMGFQTHLTALPILQSELANAGNSKA